MQVNENESIISVNDVIVTVCGFNHVMYVERPEDVDIKRAEAAKERAEERLRQKLSITQHYHTQTVLSRAMARLKHSTKRKHDI